MAIIVQGVLKDPLGNLVANVPIKVVTTSGFGDVLTTAEAIYFTDGSGNYDFNLEFATHQIYVMFTDTYELIGTTVANASVPSPTTISDLLLFSTPLPSQAEQCIRDDFGGCISALETAWDTCIVQLSTQVAQGDTGVCQAMTTYTNDRLGACSAEMTTYVNAGDAFTLQESQAYADNVGTQITCCTNLLDTRLSSVCATLSAYTAANDLAVANLCTDLTAGDAQVLLQAQAYSDVCNGITCSNLVNMVQACDAAAYSCMSAISCCVTSVETNQNRVYCQPTAPTGAKPGDVWYDSDNNNLAYYMNSSCVWTQARDGCIPTLVTCTSGLTGDIAVLTSDITDINGDICLQQAGYEIVTSAGAASASISLLATAFTCTAVKCSEIVMRADKIALHNGIPTCKDYPFYVTGGQVYMDNAYIRCLTGDKIAATTTIVAGSGTTRAGMNGDDTGTDTSNRNRLYRFWAGGEYARTTGGVPCAPFRVTNAGAVVATNAFITGCINTTCLVFNSPSAVPPELTAACAYGIDACAKAVSACTCGINCGNTAKTCAATAQSTANTACTNAASAQITANTACTNAATAQNKAVSACTCGINCGNAAKTLATNCTIGVCNYLDACLFPNQSTIQIKSGNYVCATSGWAIDNSGNAEFNNAVIRGTIVAGTGCFCGTVYAQCLVGDIVTAVQKTNVLVSNSGGTTCFGSVCINTSRPYPRTLTIQNMVTVKASSSGENPPAADVCGRMNVVFNGVTYCSQHIYNSKSSGGNDPAPISGLLTLNIPVPSNTTGLASVYLVVPTAEQNSTGCLSAPSTNNIWTPLLFTNGGDLS